MPAGLPICALRALGRRTSGNGSTGWPTPDVPCGGQGLPLDARINGNTATRPNGQKVQLKLHHVAKMAVGWPSPATRDHHAQGATHNDKARSSSLATVVEKKLAGWRTPRANDVKGGVTGSGGSQRSPGDYYLPDQVSMLVPGQEPPGSPAPTGKRGALNPELPLWLMGFPAVWLSCVDWETLSARKSRRSS